jgi:hypothetical protein
LVERSFSDWENNKKTGSFEMDVSR